MKRWIVAVAFLSVAACGGDDHRMTTTQPPPPPPPPASVTFSVNDVYALTKAQSETDDPKMVNGGDGGSITGSDETSDPVAVE